jgi:hypothetical protein
MPQLPLLPGNSFSKNTGKDKFHKSHHFDYKNEVALLVGEGKPGVGGEPLYGQSRKPKHSVFPKGEGTTAPAWVAFDRQVMCFDAYFQEAVHEKREEQYRIRKCKIYFYLEDDSIEVIEPHVKNSGIPQGTLIRRHRIPLPEPNDDQFYTVDAFNVGSEVSLYGRKFKLVNCDAFTRNFLTKLGVTVGDSKCTPEDPYNRLRDEIDQSMQPLRPYERLDKLKQFLEHDRHVLRFNAQWDDQTSMFGDVRQLIFHYFLADDTIEIREVIGANSGRDSVPVFLKRAKLPKMAPLNLTQPGEVTDRTVLNVFGPMGHGGRYILDSLKTGAIYDEYYTDADLQIGTKINVFGRLIEITDADDFTKDFYRSKYGCKDFDVKPRQPATSQGARQIPPFNGFGSEEDSLCSCMGLIPKPPQRDFIKFMEKDRSGLNSNVLRFVAFMKTENPVDAGRKFTVFFFLSDDTIAVFEPPQRNSGVIGGKFLERGRIKKPNQELFKSAMSEYYKAQDLYVGAEVIFHDHIFVIVDADEYALGYMEKHSREFQVANKNKILSKLSSKKSEIESVIAGREAVEYNEFCEGLKGLGLIDHEIITLGRSFAEKTPKPADINYARAVAQEQLRKKNFEDFTRLQEACRFEDVSNSGRINVNTLQTICRAFKLPLSLGVLAQLFDLSQDSNKNIDYNEFISNLNWRDNAIANFDQGVDSLYGNDGAPVGLEIGNVDCKKFLGSL